MLADPTVAAESLPVNRIASVCLVLKATHHERLAALQKAPAIHLHVDPTPNARLPMELPSALVFLASLKVQTQLEAALSHSTLVTPIHVDMEPFVTLREIRFAAAQDIRLAILSANVPSLSWCRNSANPALVEETQIALLSKIVNSATADQDSLATHTAAVSKLPDPFVNQTLAVRMLNALSRLMEKVCVYALKVSEVIRRVLKGVTDMNAKSTTSVLTTEPVLASNVRIPALVLADTTRIAKLRNITRCASATEV
jgi:hypothetical protein